MNPEFDEFLDPNTGSIPTTQFTKAPKEVANPNLQTFIGFCGAGGTGKTTTAKLLLSPERSYLHGRYEFLPSSSREVFKRFKVEKEADQDAMPDYMKWALQKEIQVAHRQRQVDSAGKKLLSDRTQLDQYCYALIQCSRILNEADIDWLNMLLTDSLRQYVMIFYFPLHTFDKTDESIKDMRDPREGLRLHFDTLLRGVMEKYKVFPIEVPVMTPDMRALWMTNQVNAVLGKNF